MLKLIVDKSLQTDMENILRQSVDAICPLGDATIQAVLCHDDSSYLIISVLFFSDLPSRFKGIKSPKVNYIIHMF